MRDAYVFAVAAALVSVWAACVGSDPEASAPERRGAEGQPCLANGACLAGLACVQSACVVSEAGAPSDGGTTPPPSPDGGIGDECAALSRQGTMYCPTTADHDPACAPGQACCAGTGCIAGGAACTGGVRYQCFSDQQCGNGASPKCCVLGGVELSGRDCSGAAVLQTGANVPECRSTCSSSELELCDPDAVSPSCPQATTCVRGVVVLGNYKRTVGFCQPI